MEHVANLSNAALRAVITGLGDDIHEVRQRANRARDTHPDVIDADLWELYATEEVAMLSEELVLAERELQTRFG